MQKHNVQIGTTYIVKVSDSADPVFAAMRADELEFWHELERLSQRRERYAGRRGRIVDAHKGHNGQMVYMVDLATTGSAAQSGESANFMLSSELEHIPCQG